MSSTHYYIKLSTTVLRVISQRKLGYSTGIKISLGGSEGGKEGGEPNLYAIGEYGRGRKVLKCDVAGGGGGGNGNGHKHSW